VILLNDIIHCRTHEKKEVENASYTNEVQSGLKIIISQVFDFHLLSIRVEQKDSNEIRVVQLG